MNVIEKIKAVEDKMEELGYDLDQTVYRLTYGDIACIIADFVELEQFKKLTDKQLNEMVRRVRQSFEHLEWDEVGGYAVDDVLFEIERKEL